MWRGSVRNGSMRKQLDTRERAVQVSILTVPIAITTNTINTPTRLITPQITTQKAKRIIATTHITRRPTHLSIIRPRLVTRAARPVITRRIMSRKRIAIIHRATNPERAAIRRWGVTIRPPPLSTPPPPIPPRAQFISVVVEGGDTSKMKYRQISCYLATTAFPA